MADTVPGSKKPLLTPQLRHRSKGEARGPGPTPRDLRAKRHHIPVPQETPREVASIPKPNLKLSLVSFLTVSPLLAVRQEPRQQATDPALCRSK